MLKLFKTALAAAFLVAAMPIAAPVFGVEQGAQARPGNHRYHGRSMKNQRAKRGKWQYQYVPTSSGRAGAWR